MKFNTVINKVNNFFRNKNHPGVAYLLDLIGFFLAECKGQNGWIIQECIRGVDTCPIQPGMPYFDDLYYSLH